MIQRKQRHPFLGIFSGLLLGLGLALMAIIYGLYFAGPMTPWLLLGLGVLIGIVMVFVPKLWGRKPPPATAR